MAKKTSDQDYTEEEAQRRIEAATKGALKTPHKPHKHAVKKPEKEKSPTRKPGSQ